MMGMEQMISNMLGVNVDELKAQAMTAANDARQLVQHVLDELKATKSLCEDIKTQNELIMEKLGIEIPDDKPSDNVRYIRNGTDGSGD